MKGKVDQVIHEPHAQFNDISCNLCGQDVPEVLGYRDRLTRLGPKGHFRYRIVRCQHCGLFYVSPQPQVDLSSTELYDRDYYQTHPGFAVNSEAIFKQFHKAELEQIERFVPVGRLLELGCAQGYFLWEAQKRGWKVTGIDVSKEAIGEGRRKFGLSLYEGMLDEAALPDGEYDVVYCHHMLEHTTKPYEVLLGIYRKLKPGGIVVIGVPNESAFSTLLGNLRAKMFHEEWTSNLCPPLHLFGFTPKTLRLMLEKAGLSVLKLWVSGAGSHRYPPHRLLRECADWEAFAIKRQIMSLGRCLGMGEWLVAYARK
ncbi:MAG: hypothetical protein A3G41_04255 [Elusimicrobia bacterium RIFCSPLOWO2_12_FULL_59_9]|nr:MAG: hypothetical protein A3G41_04255 [Elusimicrobia bacterium RIFCSPLOWO2_12_FULL_59_9]